MLSKFVLMAWIRPSPRPAPPSRSAAQAGRRSFRGSAGARWRRLEVGLRWASGLSGPDLLVFQIDGLHIGSDLVLVAALGVECRRPQMSARPGRSGDRECWRPPRSGPRPGWDAVRGARAASRQWLGPVEPAAKAGVWKFQRIS